MIPHLPYCDFLKNQNNKKVRYKVDGIDEEEGEVLNKRKKEKVVTYKKNRDTGWRRRLESFGREGFTRWLRIRGNAKKFYNGLENWKLMWSRSQNAIVSTSGPTWLWGGHLHDCEMDTCTPLFFKIY